MAKTAKTKKKPAKSTAKVGKAAPKTAKKSAVVVQFKPRSASRTPAKKTPQVKKKSTFAELGTSLFPLMVVNNMGKNTPGVAFTSRFTRAFINWPNDGQGTQVYVPEIAITLRHDDGTVESKKFTPSQAQQLCAALAVTMAELEIQCPENVALHGKHWALIVQRMRENKMIDADMPAEFIPEPDEVPDA